MRPEGPSGPSELVTRSRVLIGPHDALAGSDRAVDLDRPGHRLGRVLDHHDRVCAGWQHAAGRDGERPAGTEREFGRCTHLHGPEHLEVAGQAIGGTVGVGRADGEAVDRRASEPR